MAAQKSNKRMDDKNEDNLDDWKLRWREQQGTQNSWEYSDKLN